MGEAPYVDLPSRQRGSVVFNSLIVGDTIAVFELVSMATRDGTWYANGEAHAKTKQRFVAPTVRWEGEDGEEGDVRSRMELLIRPDVRRGTCEIEGRFENHDDADDIWIFRGTLDLDDAEAAADDEDQGDFEDDEDEEPIRPPGRSTEHRPARLRLLRTDNDIVRGWILILLMAGFFAILKLLLG